jgi:hypothetical protein
VLCCLDDFAFYGFRTVSAVPVFSAAHGMRAAQSPP